MASKMMAGLKAKAAEAGKAKQADMDKAKQAQQARQSEMASKAKPYTDTLKSAIQAKKAAPKAAPARPVERIPRPAGTVSPNAAKMVGKPLGGTSGGMGSMARPASPAMTPQVKQGLQSMSDKLRGMPMKRGGATKAKKK